MGNFIIFQYLSWQFIDTPKQVLKAWRNFIFFIANYFSIPILLQTFFSPWRKNHEAYTKAFSPWSWFESFVFNSFSRLIGVIFRIIFIIIGAFAEIFALILGLAVFIFWLILPFIMIFVFIYGIKLAIP